MKFRHAETELIVIGGVDRIDSAEHHRLDFLKAGEGFCAGIFHFGDGIADSGVGRGFDVRDDVADGSGRKLRRRSHGRFEDADLFDLTFESCAEQPQFVAAFEGAVEDAQISDDSTVSVVDGIENQGAGPRRRIGFRRRNEFDDGFEHLRYAGAFFRGNGNCLFARDGKNFLHLFQAHRHIGSRKVDFVDDRNDMKIMTHGQLNICNGLCLHSLGCVNDEQGAFTGCERTADFIGEVNMARGVNQIQFVFITVGCFVRHADRMRFDGDSAFLFQIHGIEELIVGQIAFFNGSGRFKQAVGEC